MYGIQMFRWLQSEREKTSDDRPIPFVSSSHTTAHTHTRANGLFGLSENWISTLDIFVYTLKFYRSVCHLNVWANGITCHIFALFIVQMIHWRSRLDFQMILASWFFSPLYRPQNMNIKTKGHSEYKFFGLAEISYTLLSVPSLPMASNRMYLCSECICEEGKTIVNEFNGQSYITGHKYVYYAYIYLYFCVRFQLNVNL